MVVDEKFLTTKISRSTVYDFVHMVNNVQLIEASRSEPHTNHHYEKIAVLMYVCIFLSMSRYVIHVFIMRAHAVHAATTFTG